MGGSTPVAEPRRSTAASGSSSRPESNWSNRQIAEIAGVSHDTVNRAANQLDEIVQLDRPSKTLGADGSQVT